MARRADVRRARCRGPKRLLRRRVWDLELRQPADRCHVPVVVLNAELLTAATTAAGAVRGQVLLYFQVDVRLRSGAIERTLQRAGPGYGRGDCSRDRARTRQGAPAGSGGRPPSHGDPSRFRRELNAGKRGKGALGASEGSIMRSLWAVGRRRDRHITESSETAARDRSPRADAISVRRSKRASLAEGVQMTLPRKRTGRHVL